ncbi:MAG: AsmA-like C-terminal region-containing protein, partial [Longimicrobiales bacterium]|nr:AsmA-like C-terminal region-containing protein [Longimicrobiales bacterium]
DVAGAGAPRGPDPATTGGANSDSGEGLPFALSLSGIRLSGGRIDYRNDADSLAVTLSALAAEAGVAREGDGRWIFDGRYRGEVSAAGTGSGAAAFPPLEGVAVDLRSDVTVSPDFQVLTVREGVLALEGITLALTGEVRDLKEPVRQLALALEARALPLQEVVALLPDSLRRAYALEASGMVEADLTADGPLGPDTLPAVRGIVRVLDGALSAGGGEVLEAVTLSLELGDDRSLGPEARGRLLGGDFTLGGRIGPRTADGAREVALTLDADPELSRIPPALLPAGLTLQGRLPSRLRVESAGAARPDAGAGSGALALRGEVGIRNLEVVHPGLGVPARVAEGRVALDGNRAVLPPTPVELGADVVELAGTISSLLGRDPGAVPEFRGTARGARISLVALSPDPAPDSALTYGQLAFARVGDRRVRGREPEAVARERGFSRPERIPLAGEVAVAFDTVVAQKGRMEEVRATLLFGPEYLSVSESSFRRYGGRVRTAAALELGSDAEEPFTLNLVLEGVQAGAFLAETTPLGRTVTGSLDLTLDLAGALDGLLLPNRRSLEGVGSFALTGGGLELGALGNRLAEFLGIPALANLRMRNWRSSFILRDGRILLDEGALEGAPGNPRVGGGIGLDGALDLVTAFDLPREDLAPAALERLGIPREAGALAVVAAVLRVGGTLADPELRADPAAALAGASEALEAGARQAVEQQVQERREALEERATGLLRGLLGGRATRPDSTRPDTLRPDTLRPDTLRPDTLRPDTLRPDTVRPDTVRPDTVRPDTMGLGRRNPG